MGLNPIKVSQLNNYIGRVLRTDPLLGSVSVVGEISNLKYHSSGHVYFSMKDESSKVNCFLAAGVLPYIACPLEEGMEIIATGNISVYERGGYYSLNIRQIETNGTGKLAELFEKLKQKLSAEGLFMPEHKKPLPRFPLRIAVVTSETGAAVKDIIRTVKNKNDVASILICPVLVQGPGAAKDIAAMIDRLNQDSIDVDLIITGRGGGSIEELWAFNEEIVARSIYESRIPIISAVGHETDFTIADFVADVRAATPTAAAEMAVPDTGELRDGLESLNREMVASLETSLRLKQSRLEALNPKAFLSGITGRINLEQLNGDRLIESMADTLNSRVDSLKTKVLMLGQIVETANPKSILGRGYSLVMDSQGNIIKDAATLKKGQSVCIETGGAKADATIDYVYGEEGHE